jgi:hypothetical protein
MEAADILVLHGSATAVERANPDKDPLVPRYRVIPANKLVDVIDGLDRAAVLSPVVRSFVDGYEFADGPNGSVLQAGISDWALLHELLEVVYRSQTGASRSRPVLTGSLDPARAGRWVMTFSAAAAFSKRDRQARQIDATGFRWESLEPASLPVDHEAPYGAGFRATRVRRRSFTARDHAQWQRELAREMPLFDGDDRFITRVVDTLRNDGNQVRWSTSIVHESEAAAAAQRQAPVGGPDTRFTVGSVVAASTKGPWIEVELTGFEDGANRVQARVATPYSGTGGGRGLHLVPEQGTTVLVLGVRPHPVGGKQLRSLAVAVCNLRDAAVALESPSLALDSKFRLALAAVDVPELGKIKIDPAVEVEVASTTTVKSGATTIDTGAQDLVFKGGNVSDSMAKGIISLG